jgi:Pterin 4 alpha carbinolamine dehydratase
MLARRSPSSSISFIHECRKGTCPGQYGISVSLRTKKIKGLHENDFIMAVKLDRLAGSGGGQTGRAIEPVSGGGRRPVAQLTEWALCGV